MTHDASRVAEYPLLADELVWVTDALRPARERSGRAALAWQKRFRAAEWVLIAGAVLAVGIGVIAAGGEADSPAAANWSRAESALTGALAVMAFAVSRLRLHARWMRQRTIAETLRAEQFLVLARLGPYATGEPRARLRERITAIEATGGAVDG